MKNTILVQNYLNGLSTTIPYWVELTDALANKTELDDKTYRRASTYLQRLNLQPDFDTMYFDLGTLWLDPEPTVIPNVRYLQYTGIIYRGIYIVSRPTSPV